MRYAMFIYTDQQADAQRPAEQSNAIMAAYGAFTADVDAAGIWKGGEALHRANTATCVRLREGQVLATDGPYAETKEQIGGYYVLECADLDEAIAYAARIPGAAHGVVEVRPVLDLGAL